MEPPNHQENKWTSKYVTPLGFDTAKTLIKTKDRLWLDSKLRLENISKRIKTLGEPSKTIDDFIKERE